MMGEDEMGIETLMIIVVMMMLMMMMETSGKMVYLTERE